MLQVFHGLMSMIRLTRGCSFDFLDFPLSNCRLAPYFVAAFILLGSSAGFT